MEAAIRRSPSKVLVQGCHCRLPTAIGLLTIEAAAREPSGLIPGRHPAKVRWMGDEDAGGFRTCHAQIHVGVTYAEVVVEQIQQGQQAFKIVAERAEIMKAPTERASEILQLTLRGASLQRDDRAVDMPQGACQRVDRNRATAFRCPGAPGDAYEGRRSQFRQSFAHLGVEPREVWNVDGRWNIIHARHAEHAGKIADGNREVDVARIAAPPPRPRR